MTVKVPQGGQSGADGGRARVCVITQRALQRAVPRCCGYEFEDVVCAVDAADLVAPEWEEARPRPWAERALAKIHRTTGFDISRDPSVRPMALRQDYDLALVVIQKMHDLLCLPLIDGWRDRCAKTVCWIEELWVDWLQWGKLLEPLREFDHVFSYFAGTVAPLTEIIDRPCSHAPAAVDALLFCPYPNPPVRSIDVYHMGRRGPATHEALFELAREKGIHYLYDTARLTEAPSHTEHRALLADHIKRSRYFFAYKAKVDAPDQTAGQEELGTRFFEGAAGGAVLLGEAPNCPAYSECFDWPDAVVRVPFGSTAVVEVMAELDAQPERVAAVRRNNIVNSLRRHDWAYRWQRVLDAVGLDPLPALGRRLETLADLADAVEKDPPRP